MHTKQQKQKIRIRLKGFDQRQLDRSTSRSLSRQRKGQGHVSWARFLCQLNGNLYCIAIAPRRPQI